MDALKNHLENFSIITNEDAYELGYDRNFLSDLTTDGKLERLRPGVYQVKGELTDDFVLISSKSKRIVFSHQTALYLHDLSDRTPNIFHISVPQGYNASHIKKRYKNLKLHYVQKDLFDVGLSEIETPLGNNVYVYDVERTICDVVLNRKKIDTQIFTDAITRYFKSNNKNLRKLIKYSRIFNIEEDIRKYIEVLS
ncbi:MAG: transcriptional regulator [Finegoldia magna]|uniref:type IV toxin-antitoxin system AbiEi family antitoxin domain-containing protein n=1 Tax=Finegoldia magna TaxID=1260 RepID=UPI000B916372|nr:type IV toxin-antitoxin system AbiEi family antitoxin domain-containing protein [Finegoldia magna]MDU5743456.1 transcriptional regulator [Finegoldia magna]OXZ39782.1 transcriptional regulator [Finegoldia magna]